MHVSLRIAILLFLLPLVHAFSFSGSDLLLPVRTDTPPILDGRLDDALWQQAPSVTGFRTFIPDFGHMMPESTVAYFAYDAENLYFAFRCFDPDPKSIKAEITSRDNLRPHDWVCINLDSFSDQQSLYALYVNPLGIQADSRFAAGIEDHSFDLVWYSAGQIDEEGYSIEIQVPLKSIRYADKNPVQMTVFFERRVSRRSEHASFPPLDPKRGYQFLTQMQPLVYHDLTHYTLFEMLPAVTYNQRYRQEAGSLVKSEQKGELSLTAKYGFTSDLILDGTINPDFSQVEADAGQVDVNLRYGLFFPEKRPFFLEGSESFGVAATGDAVQSVVHTRTIVNPLVGMKLSGKVAGQSTLASIYAVDELLDPSSGLTGEKAHFPILRYKHALTNDSYLGAIYTGRELRDQFNRVAGTDGLLRMTSSSLIEYHALFSQTKADPSAATTTGQAFAAVFRYGTRDLDFDIGSYGVSKEFAADAGYLTRTGIISISGFVRPKIYPASQILRRIDLQLISSQSRDEFSKLWETYNALSINNVFVGALSARVQYLYATEVFLGQRFRTDGFLVSGGGQLARQFNLSLTYRSGHAIFFSADPFQGRSSRLTATFNYQPWNQIEATGSLTYVDFYRDTDDMKIYEYPIARLRLTYQMNHYLFFRGVLEYNKFRRTLLNDYLISFTYIPGTVLHAGYGALYQRTKWENTRYVDDDRFLETTRGFFFKMSYLWRM
ncbi:MAG: DUF5916 domain-containing protein [Bacteroidota bacterium]